MRSTPAPCARSGRQSARWGRGGGDPQARHSASLRSMGNSFIGAQCVRRRAPRHPCVFWSPARTTICNITSDKLSVQTDQCTQAVLIYAKSWVSGMHRVVWILTVAVYSCKLQTVLLRRQWLRLRSRRLPPKVYSCPSPKVISGCILEPCGA